MSGARNTTLTAAARIAGLVLREARAQGEHEMADRIEADMAAAVAAVWTVAGPELRKAITTLAEGGAR